MFFLLFLSINLNLISQFKFNWSFFHLFFEITEKTVYRNIIDFSVSVELLSTIVFLAGNTELIIKEGPTSTLMSLEVIRYPVSQLQPLRHREHVAPVTSGFHVSLRGTFGPSSHLAIAYAAFSYMGNLFSITMRRKMIILFQ